MLNFVLLKKKYISVINTFFRKKYNRGNVITVVLFRDKHICFFIKTPFISSLNQRNILSFFFFPFSFWETDFVIYNYIHKANAVNGKKTCKQNSMRVKDQNAALFTNLRKQ